MLGVGTGEQDYIPCAWIENANENNLSSGAYIDTGLYSDEGTVWEITGNWRYAAGAGEVSFGEFRDGFRIFRASNILYFDRYNTGGNTTYPATGDHKLNRVYKNWYTANGELFFLRVSDTLLYATSSYKQNLSPVSGQYYKDLTAKICYSTTGTREVIKVRSFKWWQNGVLVRDYVPKKSKEGIYGLWDKVNGTFNVSPNGVLFAGGND